MQIRPPTVPQVALYLLGLRKRRGSRLRLSAPETSYEVQLLLHIVFSLKSSSSGLVYIAYGKSDLVGTTPEPWPTIPLLSMSKGLLYVQPPSPLFHQNSAKPPRQQGRSWQLCATPCIKSDTTYGNSAATQTVSPPTPGFAYE